MVTGFGGMKAARLKGSLKEAGSLHCERSGEVIGAVETIGLHGFWRDVKAWYYVARQISLKRLGKTMLKMQAQMRCLRCSEHPKI